MGRIDDLINRRARLLGSPYRLFYDQPLHPVFGQGVWLFDANGEKYLDVYNNVPCVGHCHPHVVEALSRQAARLNTHTRYLDENILDYAEKLLSYFPSELNQAMFTCTGSEANDLALRISGVWTGGTGVVVTKNAYHGVTTAVAQISPSLGAAINLPPHVRLVDPPQPRYGDLTGQKFAEQIDSAFQDLAASGNKPAALVLDTIFSSDGVISDPAGFLKPAVQVAHKHGALFIADEVQAGFGRVGSHMWGFQRHQVLPDLVTLGKPMGNGHPIAGLVSHSKYLDSFGRLSRYFNTFGGNPVSAAVGLAVLEVIDKESILDNVSTVGEYLFTKLRKLQEHFPLIKEVRGSGLFVGVELTDDSLSYKGVAQSIVDSLRKKNILISVSGPKNNVLKIRPPLVFSSEHVELFIDAFQAALYEVVS